MNNNNQRRSQRRKKAPQQTEAVPSEARLLPSADTAARQVLERVSAAIIALDAQWHYTYVNDCAAQLLGRKTEELVGKNIWEEFPGDVSQPFYHACLSAMAEQTPIRIEEYFAPMEKWFVNRIFPSPDGLSIFFQDITEQKLMLDASRAAASRLEVLIASLQAGVIVEDDSGQIVLANQAFCDMMGSSKPPAALTGANVVPIARGMAQLFADPDAFLERSLYLRRQHEQTASEELRLTDGRVWERDYVPVLSGGEEAVHGGHLWLYRDVTERCHVEEAIKNYNVVLEFQRAELEKTNAELAEANTRLGELATTDGLTGLLNQRVFQERLTEEFLRACHYGQPLSLIVIDVDRFKDYNDTFGHLAGNSVLKELAALLREHARDTDLVARFGGEEFVLILPHTEIGEGIALAERLRAAIEGAGSGALRAITASFGVCALDPKMDGPEALLARADVAMYRAKAGGRNRVSINEGP